jgi:hypothetical protein
MFGTVAYTHPDWLPRVAFPWWVAFGTAITYAVAVLFPTPEKSDKGA